MRPEIARVELDRRSLESAAALLEEEIQAKQDEVSTIQHQVMTKEQENMLLQSEMAEASLPQSAIEVKARNNQLQDFLPASTSWPWRFPLGSTSSHRLTGTMIVDSILAGLRKPDSRKPGSNADKDIEIDSASSAVVIEPGSSSDNDDMNPVAGGCGEIVVVGVEEAGGEEGTLSGGGLENLEFDSVSAPESQATAPGNGNAVSDVVSVAVAAAPGAAAASKPTSQAVAGEDGTAVSAPVSTSVAGVGGIAISGGHSIAISGIPIYLNNQQRVKPTSKFPQAELSPSEQQIAPGEILDLDKLHRAQGEKETGVLNECDDQKNCIISSAIVRAKSFDGEMATTLKELPVTYLIPVVINNHFYGDPNDFKEIVLQNRAPEIIEIR